MASGAGNLIDIFVDTNVLVYANTAGSPMRAIAQQTILSYSQTGYVTWISRQILREYLAVLTHPRTLPKPVPIANLLADVTRFQTEFRVAEDGPHVTDIFLNLLSQVSVRGAQVHDANIVATMQAYGIKHVLTNNVSDFSIFSAHVEVIPL